MQVFLGRYFDGRSPVAREVTVRPGARALELVDQDGAAIASWDYEDLRLVARGALGRPARLATVKSPNARLSVADHRFVGLLRERAPQIASRTRLGGRVGAPQVALAVLVVALVGAVLAALPKLAEPLAALVPAEWERRLGAQVMANATVLGAHCAEPAGERALAALAGRLAEAAHSPFPITVHVLDTDVVNAFAAPGGHVALFRGLLERAESADEVAGVLAHEIGHVVNRHPLEGLVRSLGISLIVDSLIGDSADLLGLAANAAAVLIESSYSREDEAAADAAALEILAAAGLRADGLARFFERLAALEGEAGKPGLGAYFSSHPPTEVRRAAVAAATGAGGEPALRPAQWRALQALCEDRDGES